MMESGGREGRAHVELQAFARHLLDVEGRLAGGRREVLRRIAVNVEYITPVIDDNSGRGEGR